MEAICSSETSVDTQRTTRRHIPEDDTLHSSTSAAHSVGEDCSGISKEYKDLVILCIEYLPCTIQRSN
jgi:hypothetical protein